MKEIVVLGGGTAGSLMANKLARAVPDGWRITIVDRDDAHIYQPGLLFVPFGAPAHELVRSRRSLLDPAVRVVRGEIASIDPAARSVTLEGGPTLAWDLLIIATGAALHPEETPGLTGEGWYRDAFDFYTLPGATALAARLERMERGRLVVHIAEMPIKCPVAPLEFAFLADAWLTERGLRDRFEIAYATPLDGAFTRPRASAALGDLLTRKGIQVVPSFSVSEVDGERRVLRSFDGREEPYDLLVTVPLHGGSAPIVRSGLGDAMGFVPTDRHTLAARDHQGVFVLGDATDVPTSKAGAVAHFQGDVLLTNVLRWIDGREPLPEFDGHANCFIETGHGKAMLIDFNYETEPLPGRFPLPGVGPFTLLEESARNHWGKLSFRWIYWNLLVRGLELPFDHRMQRAGKWS
ncbi:MAG TPA: FAD/NAD(P)-binding oxidoreductase [Myxococcota bacterium]|nr:FAD/NAD(P)-binding oxidoreductase [Myxococcota bacterium]